LLNEAGTDCASNPPPLKGPGILVSSNLADKQAMLISVTASDISWIKNKTIILPKNNELSDGFFGTLKKWKKIVSMKIKGCFTDVIFSENLQSTLVFFFSKSPFPFSLLHVYRLMCKVFYIDLLSLSLSLSPTLSLSTGICKK
jgi:hypothetical protein